MTLVGPFLLLDRFLLLDFVLIGVVCLFGLVMTGTISVSSISEIEFYVFLMLSLCELA